MLCVTIHSIVIYFQSHSHVTDDQFHPTPWFCPEVSASSLMRKQYLPVKTVAGVVNAIPLLEKLWNIFCLGPMNQKNCSVNLLLSRWCPPPLILSDYSYLLGWDQNNFPSYVKRFSEGPCCFTFDHRFTL